MVTFINKDSTSSNVARSTPLERRLINEQSREHRGSARNNLASSNVRQKRRPIQSRSDHVSGISTKAREATDCIDSNANSNGDTLSSTTSDPGQLILASWPLSNSATSSSSESPSSRTPSTASEISRSALSSRTTWIRIGRPKPLPILGNPIDPFATTTHTFNPTTLRLINYYKTVYYTSVWTSVNKTLSSYTTDTSTAIIIPHCTADKVIEDALQNTNRMACLLANTGSHMILSLPQQSTYDTQVKTLKFLQSGTRSLRDELTQISLRPDNDVLMSAMHLYIAASRMGIGEAASAHLKGVRTMVREIIRKGGGISLSVLGVMILVDTDLAVSLLVQSGFGYGDWVV